MRQPNESTYQQLPVTQGNYPIDAFPDIIRQAVVDVDAELGGGIELAASAALGVVSTVCQEFVNIQRPKLKPSSCSLFLITIAGTGAGKTEVQNNFIAELEAFERKEASRAAAASEEYEKLPRSARIAMLEEQRRMEYELLTEYDDLRKKEADLRERIASLNDVLSGKSPRIEVRGKRPETPEARIALANHALESLTPRLRELQSELAKVQSEIRDVMGPVARRLVYGRGSFAGFRNGLQDKCRSAGVISAEAGGILNSPLVTRTMDAWNDLWGCEFYRETYDKREYVIESPRLTLALMLQPKQFEKFIDNYGENALDNGFLSRTLLLRVPSYPPRVVGGVEDASGVIESLERFHRRVQTILDQPFPWIPERAVLTFTAEGRRYWESYYNTLSFAIAEKGRLDPEMEGFVRKLPEQAARIAALFHYFEVYPVRSGADSRMVTDAYGQIGPKGKEGEIPLETIRAAVRLCDWYMAEFRALIVSSEIPEPFSNFVYSTQVRANAHKILTTIEKHRWKYEQEQQNVCIRLEYKNIQNANRTIRNRGDILAALYYLSDEKQIHLGRGKKGGYFICRSRSGMLCGRCFTETAYSGTAFPASDVAGSTDSTSNEKLRDASPPREQGGQSHLENGAGIREVGQHSLYATHPEILASAIRVISGEDEGLENSFNSTHHESPTSSSNEDGLESAATVHLPMDQIQKAARDATFGNLDEDDELD